MKKTVVVFLALALLEASNAGLIPQSGRLFEILIDRIEQIFVNESFFDINLKIRKVNKTRSIVGYAELKVPIGDDFQLEVKSLKKQGGEYRYLPYGTVKQPTCQGAGSDKYVYPDIAKHSDFPADIRKNCPLKPGNYSFYGLNTNFDNVPKMIMPSGDYAIEGIWTNANEDIVAIARCYGQIIQI